MKHSTVIRFHAGLLLALLSVSRMGQKIHIFCEDPMHFAAFCGDLVPDNGAQEQVAEKCPVDNYLFFSFLEVEEPATIHRVSFPETLKAEPVRCKTGCDRLIHSLRAPPVR